MVTKIGLISDVHASPVPLQQALDIFEREKVSDIICAGDVAGYFDTLDETIELLERHHCKTIIGNHDQQYIESAGDKADSPQAQYLRALPETIELCIENKKLFIVHANPPSAQHGGIKLLDQYGELIQQQKDLWQKKLAGFDYDVLIVGHSHQVYTELLGNVLVINPGSTEFNHSCMILTLPDLSVQTFALENKTILKSWNFGMLFHSNNRYPSRKN